MHCEAEQKKKRKKHKKIADFRLKKLFKTNLTLFKAKKTPHFANSKKRYIKP